MVVLYPKKYPLTLESVRYPAKAQEELSLFFEKLRIKGLQIIENHVMIEINGKNCTASGTYVTEEESVREEIPEIVLQKQNDQEEEGNRV